MKTNPEFPTRERLDELLLESRTRRLSNAERGELNAILRASVEARASAAQMLMDDAALAEALRVEQVESLLAADSGGMLGAAPRPAATRGTRFQWRPLAAAAAVVLFAGGWMIGAGWKKNVPTAEKSEPVDDGVALLTQTLDASWTGARQPRAGSILSAGRLELSRGLAQLEFYSGARLIIEGPAEVELVSANRAVCHAGRIRAWVPPQARGFQVVSPEFELVDLGTEFGMEVGASASGFPSFDDVRSRVEQRAKERYASWQEWSRSLADDPRIAVRYDFEKLDGVLLDSGPTQSHGAVIGCERSNGRWAAKGALEFKRPGDRVRVNVPGTFETLTFSAWVRLDATPGRIQGLPLTDGYEPGFPHWQISAPGELRFGLRVANAKGSPESTGYGSPEIFPPRRVGVWTFLATTYDNREGRVCHYVNGKQVSSAKLWRQQALEIGKADIGNWALPIANDPYPIRNFIGRIDELTLWKVALSEAELFAIYQKTHP